MSLLGPGAAPAGSGTIESATAGRCRCNAMVASIPAFCDDFRSNVWSRPPRRSTARLHRWLELSTHVTLCVSANGQLNRRQVCCSARQPLQPRPAGPPRSLAAWATGSGAIHTPSMAVPRRIEDINMSGSLYRAKLKYANFRRPRPQNRATVALRRAGSRCASARRLAVAALGLIDAHVACAPPILDGRHTHPGHMPQVVEGTDGLLPSIADILFEVGARRNVFVLRALRCVALASMQLAWRACRSRV